MLYILDGVCFVGLACDSCIYLSVKFEYVSFPIGLYVHSFNMRNLCSVVRLCSCRFNWGSRHSWAL